MESSVYPLTICSNNRIVIAPDGWFDRIGNLNFNTRTLLINVSDLGQAGLTWLLDINGAFHKLQWEGFEPPSILQRLRISKRVERYSLLAPRQITVAELASLAAGLTEQFEEAPHSADLRAMLAKHHTDKIVSQEMMRSYLGE